ncbi:hypothetical protein [Streptomyces sp. NPDC012888]|uniref:hypothetical protein n=1 Tax=Streptomyces sp. NPDC012888 TaxID=3364855 RepID=UPI0036A98923
MTTPRVTVVRPEDYGATYGQDATAAFQRMFDTINRTTRTDPGGSVPIATTVVELAGTYVVSDTLMLPATGRAQALTIRGTGKRGTEIVMTRPKPMLVNSDRWMGVRWHDVSFRSTDPGAVYLDSYSTAGAQDWNWINCEWRGRWRYGIGLDGPDRSNLNSEFVWDRCTITGSYEDAWLWSGLSPEHPQQDQFLNYSLRDCKMEPQYGDCLRFDKGGSITVSGGSWILTGKRPDGRPSRFFHFPPGSHYDSVQNLTVTGVRFEPRDQANLVIDSHWKGMIQFIGCMDDAWAFKPYSAADDYAPHRYTNAGGVRYQGCQLTGRHRYTQTAAPSRQAIVYDQSARTVSSRRTRAAFLDLQGSNASSIRISHRDDRDGIT